MPIQLAWSFPCAAKLLGLFLEMPAGALYQPLKNLFQLISSYLLPTNIDLQHVQNHMTIKNLRDGVVPNICAYTPHSPPADTELQWSPKH